MSKIIITSGGFDNLCSRHIRFLYEISKSGKVVVLLYADSLIQSLTGAAPRFPLPERQYYLESVRYVDSVFIISSLSQLQNIPAVIGKKADEWVVLASEESPECPAFARSRNIAYNRLHSEQLTDFPRDGEIIPSSAKKVIVTGSFDWFHSGHVRFLEEASEYGNLYVVVGHDKNIEMLKGPGHPMFNEQERKFIIGSIRFVTRSMISTGHGWLDAEPEIQKIKPDIYIVNEDGDKDVKRQYCQSQGIEYIVLKREPKPGLTRRTSTNLRGF